MLLVRKTDLEAGASALVTPIDRADVFRLAASVRDCSRAIVDVVDLIDLFGDQYRRYRQQVSMLIPWPGRKAKPEPEVRHPRPAE